MAGMRSLVASALLLTAACASVALAACVEVPDNVRAHFADPREGEPNNFRKGPHGSAKPAEEEPAAPAPKAAASEADAAPAPLSPPALVDGGIS